MQTKKMRLKTVFELTAVNGDLKFNSMWHHIGKLLFLDLNNKKIIIINFVTHKTAMKEL